MKTSASLKLIIFFAAIVIVIAAQWRTTSRLRHENRELQQHAEQTRTELEQVTQASTQHESEAQSLRTEVTTLRSELQTVRHELEQAQTATKKAATAVLGTPSRIGAGGDPPVPAVPGRWSPRERTVFHMHPTARTNLVLLPEYRYAHKSGGRVDDVELWNGITRETVTAGPDWSPSRPLPLSFTDGEVIAREELGRLVHDESRWEVSDIKLHRLLDDSSTKWHYAFQFRPTDRAVVDGFTVVATIDTFTVHVSMAGEPGITGFRVGD